MCDERNGMTITRALPATIMHQIAKGYTDTEIELLAGFFAAQK